MAGNANSGKREKKFREALFMELAGEDFKEYRRLARKLIGLIDSDNQSVALGAIKEIADRCDGKVAQAIVGDDEADPIRIGSLTDEDRARALAAFIAKQKTA